MECLQREDTGGTHWVKFATQSRDSAQGDAVRARRIPESCDAGEERTYSGTLRRGMLKRNGCAVRSAGNKILDCVEPVLAGSKRNVRLEHRGLGGMRGCNRSRDRVGEASYYEIIILCREVTRARQLYLQAELGSIACGHFERMTGDVGRADDQVGTLGLDRKADGPRPGADVMNATSRRKCDGRLYEKPASIRTRDVHAPVDIQGQAAEADSSEDVSERLASYTALDQGGNRPLPVLRNRSGGICWGRSVRAKDAMDDVDSIGRR
jgi:hypothetical protein